MAVIKAELSGYIPVGVVLDDGHIRVLDGAAEMVKLQLQTRGFLESKRKGKVLTLIKEKVPVSMTI